MTSLRPLLAAFAVTGSAQVAILLMGLVRFKLVSLWLGPAGLGVLGLMLALQAFGSQIAGLGLGPATVRMIAARPHRLTRATLLLPRAAIVQGGIAAVVVFVFRVPLAGWLLDDPTRGAEVAFVGLGIPVALLAGAGTALLQGQRRIHTLARVQVTAAAAGTVLALAAIAKWGAAALPALVLVPPAVLACLVWMVPARPAATGARPGPALWPRLVRLGMATVAGTAFSAMVLLVLRAQIASRLGLDAVGLFTAAWALAVTQAGFVLAALSADFYPRLTALLSRPAEARALIDTQIRLILALGAPVLVVLAGQADLVLTLFYSEAFLPAAPLLGWMVLGTILRLPAWAMGFAMLARGAGGMFFLAELGFAMLCLGLSLILMPILGLTAVGVGFALAYGAYLAAGLIWGAAQAMSPGPVPLILTATALLLATLSLNVPALTWLLAIIQAALGILALQPAAFFRRHPA